MLSLPSRLDLRGHTERMAGIHTERKRKSAIQYMRANRVVQFIVNGGLV